MAAQPAIIASVQNITDNGSTVIKTEPTESSGIAGSMMDSQNAARALATFATKRSTMSAVEWRQ